VPARECAGTFYQEQTMKRSIEETISRAFDVVSRCAYSADQATEYLLREGVGQAQLVNALINICRDLIDSNNRLEDQRDAAQRQVELQNDYIASLETWGRK
jgi:hypothetical protein